MAKHILKQISDVKTAWAQLAENEKFSGMTHAEFMAAIGPSETEREGLAQLKALASAARKRVKAADVKSRAMLQGVVSAVKGDPAHGADSPMIRACGYVTKSERRSGLTRKSKKTTTAPTSNSSAG